MKRRFIFAVVASFAALTLSGCGMFFGTGDDWFGDEDPNPVVEIPVTTGNFSIMLHNGSTISFPEGELKIASAKYNGTSTVVKTRGTLRTDNTYGYNVVITFPGGTTGTFQIGSSGAGASFISYDGTTDGGEWEGSHTTGASDCNPDQYSLISSGFISITGYGAVGERVIGSYDLYYGGGFTCGTIKRFQGDFNIVRDL